jgi:hypothetical protein
VAILRIARRTQGSAALYDALTAELNLDEDPPEGLIMHTAGEVDGAWQVIDVWLTEAHATRFDRERREPALRKLLGDDVPPMEMRYYHLHSLLLPFGSSN